MFPGWSYMCFSFVTAIMSFVTVIPTCCVSNKFPQEPRFVEMSARFRTFDNGYWLNLRLRLWQAPHGVGVEITTFFSV
jgi:hypothetical protein